MTLLSATQRGLTINDTFVSPWSRVTCIEPVVASNDNDNDSNDGSNTVRAIYYTKPESNIFCCSLTSSINSVLERHQVEATVQSDVQVFFEQVERWAGSRITKGMKVLAIVNDVAGIGRGSGMKAVQVVQTVLQDAGISLTSVKTTADGGATTAVKKVFAEEQSNEYDAVLAVGGDGTVAEVANGLLQMGIDNEAKVGIIPSGTGNALAWSLELGYVVEAAVAVVVGLRKGSGKALKLMKYGKIDRGYDRFAVCGVMYGLVADADLGTEKIRWMGDKRFDLYALGALLVKKVYRAEVEMQIVPELQEKMESQRGVKAKLLPERGDAVEGNKVTLSSDLLTIAAWTVPFLSRTTKMFPYARWDERCIDVVVIRANISRLKSLKAFAALGNESWVDSGFEDFCDYFKVSSLKITPQGGKYISLDGESVPVLPSHLSLAPETGKIKILAPDDS